MRRVEKKSSGVFAVHFKLAGYSGFCRSRAARTAETVGSGAFR